jgi:hypothetical protein
VSSVPFTRTLDYVLRDQIGGSSQGAALRAGVVTAIPDAKHVTVAIGGQTLTIPRLSIYAPTVGEGVQILADEDVGLLLAIGAVGGVSPSGGVGPGSAVGQILTWNGSAWVAGSSAPQLGGLTPDRYVQNAQTGTRRLWFTQQTLVTDGAGVGVIGNGLGVVPAVWFVFSNQTPGQVLGATATATTITAITTVISGSILVSCLLIA